MAFPISPVEGQIYEDYIYNTNRWEDLWHFLQVL